MNYENNCRFKFFGAITSETTDFAFKLHQLRASIVVWEENKQPFDGIVPYSVLDLKTTPDVYVVDTPFSESLVDTTGPRFQEHILFLTQLALGWQKWRIITSSSFYERIMPKMEADLQPTEVDKRWGAHSLWGYLAQLAAQLSSSHLAQLPS